MPSERYSEAAVLEAGERIMGRGKVVRLENFGLGFLQPEGSQKQYPFTFDQIDGYRGESPWTLGLRIGADVNFILRDDQIEMIQLDQLAPATQLI
jgi:hypothetical protein